MDSWEYSLEPDKRMAYALRRIALVLEERLPPRSEASENEQLKLRVRQLKLRIRRLEEELARWQEMEKQYRERLALAEERIGRAVARGFAI